LRDEKSVKVVTLGEIIIIIIIIIKSESKRWD